MDKDPVVLSFLMKDKVRGERGRLDEFRNVRN